MVTIAWYNIVAIVVLAVWLLWVSKNERDPYGLSGVMKLFVGLLFLILWGGIFWW